MRLCRFRLLEDEVPLVGFYLNDRVIPIDQAAEAYADEDDVDLIIPATNDLLDLLPPDGEALDSIVSLSRWIDRAAGSPVLQDLTLPVDDVQLLVPIPQPPKILLLAGNYADHVQERGGITAQRGETFPYVFMKPPTTLIGSGSPIVLPACSPDHIDWECELALIIGRDCRNVTVEEALSHVAGYTVLNDISDREFRPNPNRKVRERDRFFDWLHGKWHDTFCPVGPCVLSAGSVRDPQSFDLRLTVNGQVKQQARASQMIFPVSEIIAFLSTIMTLQPGDIIATGTPSGVGSASGVYLRDGDLVIASIEGIGRLENPVVVE